MPLQTEPDVSIVVPVYNGSLTVGHLVEELTTLPIAPAMEVILVNDGSRDGSATVCRQLADRHPFQVTLVDLAKNFGEHNAVVAGLRQARGRWVITMDDDLQNPPHEVQRLYEKAVESGVDVVYTRFRNKNHAAWRNIGSRLANVVANLVLNKPNHLYLSSFRCMSRFTVDQVAAYDGAFPYVDGLIFQSVGKFETLEVDHLPRAEGRSNYTLWKLFRLWLNIALNFSTILLHLATVLGLACVLVGLVGGVYVLVDYLMYGADTKGWTSMFLGLVVFSGVQLLILGMVGEYLGRVFLTVNRKPQSVVREVYRASGVQGGSAGGDQAS